MVTLANGSSVIIYISNRPELVTKRLASHYMARVAAAAERQGLSPEYMDILKAYLG